MNGVWLGIFFLSSSWLFLSPVLSQNYVLGLSFVVLGLMTNVVSLRCTEIVTTPKPDRFVCGILLICIAITPFPYNLPFVFLAIGFFIRFFTLQHSIASALENGFLLSGCILLIQAALVPFYLKVATRLPDLNTLAYPVYLLLKLFGIETTFGNHFLFVRDSVVVHTFYNDIGKFGLYMCIHIVFGSLPIIFLFLRSSRLRAISEIIFLATAYVVLRYTALIMFYQNYQTMSIFTNPWFLSVSFLPLAMAYYRFFPLTEFQVILPSYRLFKKGNKTLLFAMTASALGVFLIVGSWGFNDPGKMKKGHILIDEKHSNWEWTTQKFDKESYGQKAAYNYYCLSNFLGHFYTVETCFHDLTEQTLESVDVLIIKMPTEPFESKEISAIMDFVERGGGLFLIGDHTNVFGTSGYLNQLSERFGLHFNFDATYDLISGNLSLYKPPRLLAHPVVRNLPPFLFGTSCTLSSPILAEDVMTGYQLRSMDLDYAKKHFFPGKIDLPSSRFGIFLQCSAIKHGKGRVLAFSDSTVFSNFWIFMPGKAELLLGILDWLNRENLLTRWTNAIFLLFGFLMISISVILIYKGRQGDQGFFRIFFSALLALPFSFLIFGAANSFYNKQPEAKKEYQRVFFDLEHSNMPLPLKSLVNQRDSYETFFVLFQRLGYVPSAKNKLEECLEPNAILVIINPDKEWSDGSIQKLQTFVEEGGRLVVMDNRCNKNSTSKHLLESFQMEFSFTPLEVSVLKDFQGRSIPVTKCAARVQGGQPVLSTLSDEPIVSILDRGKGRLVVVSDAHLFSDKIIGTTMSTPNSYQKSIFDMAFYIFEKLTITDKIKNR